MAAPQTHLVIAFVIRVIITFVFDKTLSIWETVSIYFWGSLMDFADHFWPPSYAKDIIFVRIPRFLKGGSIGKPSPDVELPKCWLHFYPSGIIIVLIWSFIFYQIDNSFMLWIPLALWLQHVIIDRYQKNDATYPYFSSWYPFVKKTWVRKKGYPTKPRIEILASTALAVVIIIFEIWFSFFK